MPGKLTKETKQPAGATNKINFTYMKGNTSLYAILFLASLAITFFGFGCGTDRGGSFNGHYLIGIIGAIGIIATLVMLLRGKGGPKI